MATAAKPSAREAHAKARGGQGPTSNTRINLSPASGTLLSLDGEEVLFPVGCSVLEIQPRLCGDYYAEIRGASFCVAGFAPDALSAARNAIARVPA